MMAELKPCPFCGGKAFRWQCTPDGKYKTILIERVYGLMTNHFLVECTQCGIRTKVYATSKGCFNAWNRRYTPPTEIDFDYGAED
jgi:Lar family restriction alleviation protein